MGDILHPGSKWRQFASIPSYVVLVDPVYLDFKTESTVATSITHFKLDYCITQYTIIYHELPNSQINPLQQIYNSHPHSQINEVLNTSMHLSQFSRLLNLFTPPSSSVISLTEPPISSSLKTNLRECSR